MTDNNRYKLYVDNTYYHCYNRGVEKRIIFQDDQDYKTFLSYLKFYLSDPSLRGQSSKSFHSQQLSNHFSKIELIAYCLMPNHFHLLIKQTNQDSMTRFIRALCTRYSIYFNKRYNRVGSLYQGRYKAVLVDNEMQFLYLTKYIHRNPLSLVGNDPTKLTDYTYSSYHNYLNIIHQDWVNPENITYRYSPKNPNNTYRSFVEESKELATEITTLGNITLDWDT